MNTAATTALSVRDPWSLVPSLGNLDAYVSAVNRLPLLTPEEEVSLARRLRERKEKPAVSRAVLRRFIIQMLMCNFELSIRSLEEAYPIKFDAYFALELEQLKESVPKGCAPSAWPALLTG